MLAAHDYSIEVASLFHTDHMYMPRLEGMQRGKTIVRVAATEVNLSQRLVRHVGMRQDGSCGCPCG